MAEDLQLWFTGTDMHLVIRVGPGELVSRLTVLELLSERMDDVARWMRARRELPNVSNVFYREFPFSPELERLRAELRMVNARLMQLERELREFDLRARLEREVDDLFGGRAR